MSSTSVLWWLWWFGAEHSVVSVEPSPRPAAMTPPRTTQVWKQTNKHMHLTHDWPSDLFCVCCSCSVRRPHQVSVLNATVLSFCKQQSLCSLPVRLCLLWSWWSYSGVSLCVCNSQIILLCPVSRMLILLCFILTTSCAFCITWRNTKKCEWL